MRHGNDPVRIMGRSAYRFINDICNNRGELYLMNRNFYEYWDYLAEYARNNFAEFLEDVLDDYLDEHLPGLLHAGRYGSRFNIEVTLPNDYQFIDSVNCVHDYPESIRADTIHITVQSQHFRTFALAYPMPGDYVLHEPRHMKELIETIGDALFAHFGPNRGGYFVRPELVAELRRINDQTPISYSYFREETEQQKQANKKALELLLSHCSRKQKSDYKKNSWLVVRGKSGTRYRIRKSRQINVDVLDSADGVKYRLCTIPDKNNVGLPIEDQLLAQKTLIELNEQLFLETAIRWETT